MFEVFTNSIVYPKNIINYHSKKGGFVFLYILILVLLMSISTIVFYISSKPQEITSANSGCQVITGSLDCSGDSYDLSNEFIIYDFDLYLLAEEDSINDISDRGEMALILQGSALTVLVGTQTINSFNFLSNYSIETIEEAINIIEYSIIFAGVLMGIVSNTLILLFIILISTIPFIRFKSLISYKKIFKMLTFAATPMAFLFAIYNLLRFDMFIFFILMLFAYRSVFTLQKELHIRVIGRSIPKSDIEAEDDEIVDFDFADDEFDEKEEDNYNEEESQDDEQ